MTSSPAVSVLMAVYNGENYLENALSSIMAQSLREIEIIVVDDSSTDGTPGILERMARSDSRIRVFRTPRNLHLAGALNMGLEHVRAPLVARMDDDDFSFPERLSVQKAVMDARPDLTLLGTSFETMDGQGVVGPRSVRARDSFAIRWALRFSSNVLHPSFMFRRELPDGTAIRYDKSLELAQDYDLLCRVALAQGELACLPDVLMRYRKHDKSVSVAKLAKQRAIAKGIGTAFQKADLPADVFDALAPLRASYWDSKPADRTQTEQIFASARAMLRHDLAQHPDRAAWLRRQTAQLIPWILQRGGASKGEIVTAFLRHGPDMLPTLVLRWLEIQNLLPGALNSEPDIAVPTTQASPS